MRIGYHASHEQYRPSELLRFVQLAEKAHFDFIFSSDHLAPWSNTQGNSGFTWSWLGSALQATSLPFGVISVPGYRYHPVVLAQAIATLVDLYPNRLDVAMGSGEALNEHMIGKKWPSKAVRNEILKEGVEIMERLWRGERVSHHGHLRADDARLFVLPAVPPKITGAALTPKTAEWLGSWADGLVTTTRPAGELREIIDAFRRGGGQGKPLQLQMQLSFDTTHEKAYTAAYEQWRFPLLPTDKLGDLYMPEDFEAAAKSITKERIEEKVPIITKPQQLEDLLATYAELGFEKVIIHNVNRNQEAFIAWMGEHILDK